MKPLVGISCCTKLFGTFGMPNHAASDTYVRVTDEVIGGGAGSAAREWRRLQIKTLLARLDGIILTGSRSNVQPSLYNGPPHAEGTPEDPARDGMTLPLIRAAVRAGVPVLAICRGFQNSTSRWAARCTSGCRILPDRLDHSTPMQPSGRVRTGKAHAVAVVPGSWLHRVAAAGSIAVNSLHNQGVDQLAPGLVVEGTAPDGTIEAARLVNAPGFAVGVQWHRNTTTRPTPCPAGSSRDFAEAVQGRLGAVGVAAD